MRMRAIDVWCTQNQLSGKILIETMKAFLSSLTDFSMLSAKIKIVKCMNIINCGWNYDASFLKTSFKN